MLEKKENIVVGAAVSLVVYTLLLSALGPTVQSATTNKSVSNAGTITAVGVGIYWNQACTNPVSSISWGIIDAGSNKTSTVYIRNEGNTPATLTLATANWNPSGASSYITLSWNYGGQTLGVNQVVQVVFTLSVSSSISGITSFSFDIIITATS